MSRQAEASHHRRQPRSALALVVVALAALLAFAGFVALGNWQLRRLSWKRHLIAETTARVHRPPVAAPGPAQWASIRAGHRQYLHVRVSGRFINDDETLVHGTSRFGYGYWLMTPLRSDAGFIVLVNRGYVPASLPGTPGDRALPRPEGEVTVTGLLRLSEPRGGFLRSNDPARHRWYSRDVDAIAAALKLPADTVAPYFIDADAQADRQGWPAGGQTVIHFPNHHLNYAITWYILALGVIVAAGFVVRYEWRNRRSPQR